MHLLDTYGDLFPICFYLKKKPKQTNKQTKPAYKIMSLENVMEEVPVTLSQLKALFSAIWLSI